MKKIESVTSHNLYPPPPPCHKLSHFLRPPPPPWSVTYFMDGPFHSYRAWYQSSDNSIVCIQQAPSTFIFSIWHCHVFVVYNNSINLPVKHNWRTSHEVFWAELICWMLNRSLETKRGTAIFTMETTTYLTSNGTFGNLTNSPKPAPTTSTLELAFRWCVFLAGTIGLLANALVVFALSSKTLQKRTSNVLIRSQVFFDLLVCACLMISYGYRVWFDEIPLSSNSLGNFVCIAVYGNGLLAVTLCASLANLGIIAFERYVKIVHLVKHRNYFRRYFFIRWIIFHNLLINYNNIWHGQPILVNTIQFAKTNRPSLSSKAILRFSNCDV